MRTPPPVCMTVAGVDPSGGAGVLADIKTFSAFGCFGTAAVTSLTFQNTVHVTGSEDQSGETVRRQIGSVAEDMPIAAIKTGMLPSREVIEAVADAIKKYSIPNLVVDPVIRSTSGFDLIDDDAMRAMIDLLFPLACVVTPNLTECERIVASSISTESDLVAAAQKMRELGVKALLAKGGHQLAGEASIAKDRLFFDGGIEEFTSEFIETTSTHGTGCVLSAAIAANLALGHSLTDAIRVAKSFVYEAIRNSPGLGRGNSPIDI